MSSDGYRILDEPQPGALARYAVSPMWPLFAMMFGGAWFSWLWFLFNGHAVGSPTRRKEIATAVVGFAGMIVLPFLLIAIATPLGEGKPSASALRYLEVLLDAWKVGVTYVLYFLQTRSIELYEYYGGVLKSGLLGVVAGYFLNRLLLAHDHGILQLLLG